MNMRHLPVLAIDPSTAPGYALWHPEEKKVYHGSWNLRGKASDKPVYGKYFRTLLANIESVLDQHGLWSDLRLRVVMEAPAPGAMRNAGSISLSEGWGAIVSLFCHDQMLVQPTMVPINSWRSYFLERKKPKDLKGEDARAWFKREVVLQCRAYGLSPEDDNSADAIGMLVWFLDGGEKRLVDMREDKREATRLKRNQGKFNFGAAA
jgi:hypothetical protein